MWGAVRGEANHRRKSPFPLPAKVLFRLLAVWRAQHVPKPGRCRTRRPRTQAKAAYRLVAAVPKEAPPRGQDAAGRATRGTLRTLWVRARVRGPSVPSPRWSRQALRDQLEHSELDANARRGEEVHAALRELSPAHAHNSERRRQRQCAGMAANKAEAR